MDATLEGCLSLLVRQIIEVHEFFLEAGAFLNAPSAQQSYVSLNYTHVARKILDFGVNVRSRREILNDNGPCWRHYVMFLNFFRICLRPKVLSDAQAARSR
jgi:hypothetical protein